ncbi:MAG: ATP-grasp domain-containing protein [Anaerolineae bacterium]
MPTLILSPRYTPDSAALWKAALSIGWSVERLESYRVPEHLQGEDFVIYGEGLFARIVAESLALALLEPPHDWLAGVPIASLQRRLQFTTLVQARAEFQPPLFVNPGDSSKSFDARVYQQQSELPAGDDWDDTMPVIVSEPVSWLVEYRCFLLDGKAAALSVYKRAEQTIDNAWNAPPQELEEARQFCNRLASSVHLPPSVVLDVGKIADRGWAVVEANPSWASGIYGCDVLEVLKVIQRGCVPQSALSAEDVRWVL